MCVCVRCVCVCVCVCVHASVHACMCTPVRGNHCMVLACEGVPLSRSPSSKCVLVVCDVLDCNAALDYPVPFSECQTQLLIYY